MQTSYSVLLDQCTYYTRSVVLFEDAIVMLSEITAAVLVSIAHERSGYARAVATTTGSAIEVISTTRRALY